MNIITGTNGEILSGTRYLLLCICCTLAAMNGDTSGCTGQGHPHEPLARIDGLLTFAGQDLEEYAVVSHGRGVDPCEGCGRYDYDGLHAFAQDVPATHAEARALLAAGWPALQLMDGPLCVVQQVDDTRDRILDGWRCTLLDSTTGETVHNVVLSGWDAAAARQRLAVTRP